MDMLKYLQEGQKKRDKETRGTTYRVKGHWDDTVPSYWIQEMQVTKNENGEITDRQLSLFFPDRTLISSSPYKGGANHEN